MGRARANPFQGFTDVMGEMGRMRELGRTGYGTGPEDRRRTHADAWVPTTDVFARDTDLVIRLELAGVSREEIDVTLLESVLTISGTRRSELDEERVRFYTRERFYGAFRRSMVLPEDVDETRISATFVDGVVEITIRGAAATTPQPRRIEIGDGSS